MFKLDFAEFTKVEEKTTDSIGLMWPANVKHRKNCLIFMALTFGGASLSFIGHIVDPTTCAKENLIAWPGVPTFLFGTIIGFAYNFFTLTSRVTEDDFDYRIFFLWSLAHVVVVILSLLIFADHLLTDIWCGGRGPGPDFTGLVQ